MMTPKFICFDETGLDEFFIFKHRYEKEVLCLEDHIPYTEFIGMLLDKIKSKSYYSAATKNSIGFTDITIGEDRYVVHTPADDDTTREFFNIMKEIDYDYSSLNEIDMRKLPEDLDNMSFFTIDRKMMLV